MELNVPSGDHETESNLTTARSVSDAEDEGVSRNSRGQRNTIPEIIHIPSASERKPGITARHRKYSSSQESDDYENTEDVNGLAPPEVLLKSYRRRAREFKSMGDERAVSDCVRCVALSRILHGDNHWKLAKAHSKLSQAYLEQGGMAEQALLHAENARNVLLAADTAKQQGRQVYDRSDVLPIMELIYLVMGKAQLALKNTHKAEQNLKKAEILSQEREGRGYSHQAMQRRLEISMSLGRACLRANKSGHALEAFEKALQITQAQYGDDSAELIPIYQCLAKAESSQGNASSHERATQVLLQAHEISRARYGEDSIEFAESSFVVATSYINSFDGDAKAKNYLEDVVRLNMQHRGPYHSSTIKAQDELSRLLVRGGFLEEAVSLQKSVADAKVVLYGDPSQEAADCYQMLGSIRLKQGRLQQALKWLTKGYNMLTVTLGTSHKRTKQMGDVISRVKKSPDAQRFLNSEEKLKKRPRFTQVVGRAKPLGYSATPTGE